MRNTIAIAALAAAIASVVAAPASALEFHPGKWAMTATIKTSGFSLPIPARTVRFTQCLTRRNPVPQRGTGAQACQTRNLHIAGDTVTYDLLCREGPGDSTGRGRVTYAGDRVDGVVIMTLPAPAPGKITEDFNGRRIGACTAN